MGQDSDSEDSEHGDGKMQVGIKPSGENRSDSAGETTKSTTNSSMALEQLQRLSDPTPTSTATTDETTDKPAATLPRNFPKQQVRHIGIMLELLFVLGWYYPTENDY